MQTILKISRALFLSLLVGVGFFAAYILFNPGRDEIVLAEPKAALSEADKVATVSEVAKVAEVPKVQIKTVSLDVPFTSQAPTGKWSNPLFENGCEEASIAMAMAWVQGKKFSTSSAEKEILDISAWEEKTFGFAIDSSVADTARILREYYNHQNIEVLKNITGEDIKQELAKGRVVVVPAIGKTLANPHYTPPGPDQHMLLVSGYDSKTDEFITNDPGTKFGEGYRYDAETFMDAVWSYPSGSEHAAYPGSQRVEKDIISIGK